MQSSVSVLRRRQRTQNKRPTSRVVVKTTWTGTKSQPRTECMETETRPRPWEVENKSSEPWENNHKALQNKQQIQTRRSWNQLYQCYLALIHVLPLTLYNRFFCSSIRFCGCLLSSYTNPHKECTKPLFSAVIREKTDLGDYITLRVPVPSSASSPVHCHCCVTASSL